MTKFAVFFDDSTQRSKRISNVTYDSLTGWITTPAISVEAAQGIKFRENPEYGTNYATINCNADLSGNRLYTVPSCPDAFFVMTEADQRINGRKSFQKIGASSSGYTPVYLVDIYGVTSDSTGLFRITTHSNTTYPSITLKREGSSSNLADGDILSEIKTIGVPVYDINMTERVMGSNQFIFKTGNKSNYLIKTDLGSGLVNSFKIDENLKYSFYNPSGTAVSLKVHPSGTAVDYILPVNGGIAGQILSTDGTGRLFWLDSSFSWNKYEFTVAPGGETSFTAGEVLASKPIEVLVDGQLMRQGVGNDYTVAGSTVTFNYTLKEGSWVFISVFSTLELINNDFDVSTPQTTFTTSGDITALMVKVYENGVLKREGVAYDYTISESSVVFNSAVQSGAWVRVAVYGG